METKTLAIMFFFVLVLSAGKMHIHMYYDMINSVSNYNNNIVLTK